MIRWFHKLKSARPMAEVGTCGQVQPTEALQTQVVGHYETLKLSRLDVGPDERILGAADGIALFGEGPVPDSLEHFLKQVPGREGLVAAIRASLFDASVPNSTGSPRRSITVPISDLQQVRYLEVLPIDTSQNGTCVQIRTIYLRDVTAQEAVQQAKERRISLMERALDRAPFGLVVLDQRGMVRSVNTAFKRLLNGRSLIDTLLAEVFHPDDRSEFTALVEALTKPGDTPNLGPYDLRLDNSQEDRVVTVFGNRTHVVEIDEPGILLHVIDATERKRLEKQFAQSQKMQAVGQLAGGIAHDFNNVLTAIIGFCDLLLQRHQPGDPSFADVMQIQQNANRAAGLTRQLLAFSRQQTIRSRIVDLTDTLAELSNLLRRLLGESVDLSVLHGQDLWTVRGDRGQLEQVVINLAVNARDAMEKGGQLIIQTDNFTADQPYQMRDTVMSAGDYVTLSVTDTGIGMAQDVLSRIFEPFFTTKEVGRGTGLGLAMVYGSISQMGGHIVAHSDGPGKGSTFSLYLPRAVETEKDRAAGAEGDDASNQNTASDDTGGESILLVEDEDAVRLFSARALRSKGYNVTEARTGEIALEILADQSFDLLVTDMVMPKVDGATLIHKARETRPNLPVICISGYTRESVAKEVAELPRISFLSKPFSLKQLTSRVRSVLSDR